MSKGGYSRAGKLPKGARREMRKAAKLYGGRIPAEAAELTVALEDVCRRPYTPEQQVQPDTRHGRETMRRVRAERWRRFKHAAWHAGAVAAMIAGCAAFWVAVAWAFSFFFLQ